MHKFARATARLLATVTMAGFATAAPPSFAGEQDDVALAEALIAQIKTHLEADSRAYHRAVNALSETSQGKQWLKRCPSRNHLQLWTRCMHDDDWKFSGAYKPLYDRFYEEEMAAIEAAGSEVPQEEGNDQ